MNIYVQLNEVLQYIESHLAESIDYSKLSKLLGCNEFVLTRLFSFLTGYSLKEYIRSRRLTIAAIDLMEGKKVIDVSQKYGYSSPISFTRAFKQMHGCTPKDIKTKNLELKLQPVLSFKIEENTSPQISYQIKKKKKLTFYGKNIVIPKNEIIPPYANDIWDKMLEDNEFKDQKVKYGIVEIKKDIDYYWCCTTNFNLKSEKITIPSQSYLILTTTFQNGNEIKKLTEIAYKSYIPAIQKKVNYQYTIEAYYPDYLEIWIAIY